MVRSFSLLSTVLGRGVARCAWWSRNFSFKKQTIEINVVVNDRKRELCCSCCCYFCWCLPFFYYYSYSKEDGSSYSRRRVEQTELDLATATGAVRLLRGLSFPDASLSMATWWWFLKSLLAHLGLSTVLYRGDHQQAAFVESYIYTYQLDRLQHTE